MCVVQRSHYDDLYILTFVVNLMICKVFHIFLRQEYWILMMQLFTWTPKLDGTHELCKTWLNNDMLFYENNGWYASFCLYIKGKKFGYNLKEK